MQAPTPTPNAPGPLAGFRVLDLTTEAGQYTGRLLAELGADVIKVEPPGGDAVRRVGPFYHDEPHPERSLLWFVLNASKRGVTLDLGKPEGARLLQALARAADVVVESFQPGRMAELGLDHARLSQENPTLVMASISGFGQSGPYRDFKWSDIVASGMGGFLFLNGDPDRPPVRMFAPQAYYNVSLQAAIGVEIALFHRVRTGQGQYLDVSAQEAVTYDLNGPGTVVSWWTFHKRNIARSGGSLNLGEIALPVMVPCKDGYMAWTSVMGPRRMPPVIKALDEEGMAGDLTDPKWLQATTSRAGPGQWRISQEQMGHIFDLVIEWQMKHTKKEIYEKALHTGMSCFPVNTAPDLLENEQLEARSYFTQVEHPELGASLPYQGPPFKLPGSPYEIRRRAPLLGEHNDEVYGGLLGLSTTEQQRLKKAGVL